MLKYKISVLFLFILGICTFSFVSAKTNVLPLLGKVIYLDPGHGGLDPGAVYKDLEEASINLELSRAIEDTLTKMGAIVYLTRTGDYDLAVPNTINRKRSDLSRRGNIINRSMCDLYLSIHLNAETSSTWRGAQVFYDDINPNNKKIAEIFQNELKKSLHSTRDYKESTDLYLGKRIERPGILIEVGFITNPNDRYLLKQKSYHRKVAESVSRATVKYFQTIN